MSKLIPAEAFPPGEFIKDELEARGWSQIELAEILGRDTRLVNEVIAGKRAITPETAQGLGEAFGTGAQFWMNLEAMYQLAKMPVVDDAIARRAKLYERFPVREMIRRNWIEAADDISVLEKRFLDFFGLKSLDDQPSFAHASKKSSNYYSDTSILEWAWLFRARQIARAVSAGKFSDKAFAEALEKMRKLLPHVEEIRHIPRILSEAGVRFVIVEAIPGTRIDGACFWLDKYSPVIALSLRFDRIDNFWFTVLHESDHVRNRHGMDEPVIDVDLVGEGATPTIEKPEAERKADEFAAEYLLKKIELDKYVARIHPLYSTNKIIVFAQRMQVHPGVVVGQLQYRGKIPYSHFKDLLVKVRSNIIPSVLTDGWGNKIAL